MSARATAEEVLAFWFGDPPVTTPRKTWFMKDAAFDAEIAQRFGSTIEQALAGAPLNGADTAGATLARILVLDQFTRNVFRDTPRAFAGDKRARALAQQLVDSGGDRQLTPVQRPFAYLPFEHAESAAAQAESLRLFKALAAEHPGSAEVLHWAEKHARIIERFGRYPHRNLVLGRLSTPEEAAFLREPGSSF